MCIHVYICIYIIHKMILYVHNMYIYIYIYTCIYMYVRNTQHIVYPSIYLDKPGGLGGRAGDPAGAARGSFLEDPGKAKTRAKHKHTTITRALTVRAEGETKHTRR